MRIIASLQCFFVNLELVCYSSIHKRPLCWFKSVVVSRRLRHLSPKKSECLRRRRSPMFLKPFVPSIMGFSTAFSCRAEEFTPVHLCRRFHVHQRRLPRVLHESEKSEASQKDLWRAHQHMHGAGEWNASECPRAYLGMRVQGLQERSCRIMHVGWHMVAQHQRTHAHLADVCACSTLNAESLLRYHAMWEALTNSTRHVLR